MSFFCHIPDSLLQHGPVLVFVFFLHDKYLHLHNSSRRLAPGLDDDLQFVRNYKVKIYMCGFVVWLKLLPTSQ